MTEPALKLIVRDVPEHLRERSRPDVRALAGGPNVEPELHVLFPLFHKRPELVDLPRSRQQWKLDEIRQRKRDQAAKVRREG